ncbi:MAG: transporter permease [Actinomycetia bacterium]|nr:transporter permease [Actinomycetes bacterium]
MGTRQYVIRKIVQAFVTLLAILIFNFFLFRVWSPGDPVSFLTRGQGFNLSLEERAAVIEEYGLDKSTWGQFTEYMKDTFTGKLGVSSFYQGESVMAIFFRFLTPTLLLVGISTMISMVVGIWMGIRSGWRRGSKFDRGSMFFSLILYSMPEFWLGMLLLMLFSSQLGWFPVGGRVSTNVSSMGTLEYFTDVAEHLFLPVLTLALGYLGEFYLLMRSSLLDVLGEDYITTARAKGVLERNVLNRHAVRNALLPTVTLIALSFGYVIGGAITVEVVFSYQGLGLLTYTAIVAKDYWLLQGLFLFFSLAVIAFNLVSDLVYAYLDPRVREA